MVTKQSDPSQRHPGSAASGSAASGSAASGSSAKAPPPWLAAYVRPDTNARIVAAVRAAEATTSGEIVPMVVRASAATGHAGVMAGFILLFLYFALGLSAYLERVPGPTLVWELSLYLMALVVGQLLGRVRLVQSLLTPPADKHNSVMKRAQLAFHQAGLEKTAGATGVLLYLSLMERQAVVLADKAIAAKLPPETWSGVAELLIAGMARGDLAGALEAAVKRCGEILAPHFPPSAENPDELPNELLIRD